MNIWKHPSDMEDGSEWLDILEEDSKEKRKKKFRKKRKNYRDSFEKQNQRIRSTWE